MRLNIACFAAGIAWLQQQSELPASHWMAALAGGAALLWALAPRGERWKPVRGASLALASGVAGFVVVALFAHLRLAEALPPPWEGRDVAIIGVVADLPHADPRRVRFEFDIERIATPGASVPRRVILSWWGADAVRGGAGQGLLRVGERWILTVRLKRPRGTANPHGFDYEAWLLEKSIRATGYVRRGTGNRRLDELVHRPRYWIGRARELARARVLVALPDAAYAGVIAALVIGDQRSISPGEWQVFTRTGVNHLMSISGLHVTMVSGLAFALVSGLWRRWPALTLHLPARKAATIAGLLVAFCYALLSGFAVPAQRTVYMLAVVALALWLGAVEAPATVLAVAVFVVLLLDPWAVLAPGFWLSFGAVATIMYVTVGRVGRSHWLPAFGRLQIAVTIALVPPLLAMFQQVSMVSPLANALAIPVVSLLVVPISLVGAIMPFDLVLQIAHAVLAGCLAILDRLSALPAAVWTQHAPPAWTVGLAVGAVLLLLAPRGVPARWLGAIALAPMFVIAPAPPGMGALHVAVLDVGQGVAVVLRTARHALLYDTGPSFGPDADSGSRIIVPYLRAIGVKHLDGVIVSHDDDDHAGGTLSVLQAVPVGWLMTSMPDLDPAVLLPQRSYSCQAGARWEWDGVRFEILHPARASYDDSRLRDNDRSCVLKIETPALSVLLPGDIERHSEKALVAARPGALRSDILLAPHQGSRTSSSSDFIATVGARAVIFPVGYRNRFGHPHADVLARYLASGARVYRTDRDGALLIEAVPDSPIHITPYRAIRRRYWQSASPTESVPGPGLL